MSAQVNNRILQMIQQTMGLRIEPNEPIADDKLKGGDSAIDAIENVFKMEGGVTRTREGNLFPVEHIEVEPAIEGGANDKPKEQTKANEKETIEKLQEEAEVDPDKDISDEEVSEDKKVDSNEEDHLNEEEFNEDHEEESSSSEDDEITQFITDMNNNKINFMGGGVVEPKPSLYIVDHYPFILKQ